MLVKTNEKTRDKVDCSRSSFDCLYLFFLVLSKFSEYYNVYMYVYLYDNNKVLIRSNDFVLLLVGDWKFVDKKCVQNIQREENF